MTNNGWRKPTPGLSEAEKHAQAGKVLSVPKNQAILAVKRVAATLALKPADLLLLDTLCAFTKPQDWEKGARPIVWASNNFLIEQIGMSLSAVKRHARRLAEFGLITFRDSPNGKRWGKRGDDGRIVEAYGFDLSPLAGRAEEFERLYAEIKEERQLVQGIKRQITIARRSVSAILDMARQCALKGDWLRLSEAFRRLIELLPSHRTSSSRLLDIYDGFRALKKRVDDAFDSATIKEDVSEETKKENINTNPRVSTSEPHILITKQPHSVSRNINEIRKEKIDASNSNGRTERKPSSVEITTIMQSCPAFADMAHGAGGYIQNWQDFHRAAGQIRPMIGISDDAWQNAQSKMGPYVAAAAIALITDKYSDGEVQSPGGYLRGMVEKLENGELHLDRSFYGRLVEKTSVMHMS